MIMAWYWIVLLTLLGVWTVSVVLAQFDEDYTLWWAWGLLYPVLYLIFYPIRAVKRYNRGQQYYERYGNSKVKYIFGKRPKDR